MSADPQNEHQKLIFLEIQWERNRQDERRRSGGLWVSPGSAVEELAKALERLARMLEVASEAPQNHALTPEAELAVRKELVQLAAVVVAWIEALDRRAARRTTEPEPMRAPTPTGPTSGGNAP